MKLELKHLAGYLPYGLKGKIFYADNESEKTQLCLLDGYDNDASIGSWITSVYPIKPILRPLSDLTKEIEHNGESFVPIVELYRLVFGGYSELNIKETKSVISCETCIDKLSFYPEYVDFKTIEITPDGESDWSQPFYQYQLHQKLYEWHLDIHGLIEKGLAIDINTLNI